MFKKKNVSTLQPETLASVCIFPASNHLAQVSKKPEGSETLAPLGFSSQTKNGKKNGSLGSRAGGIFFCFFSVVFVEGGKIYVS